MELLCHVCVSRGFMCPLCDLILLYSWLFDVLFCYGLCYGLLCQKSHGDSVMLCDVMSCCVMLCFIIDIFVIDCPIKMVYTYHMN